MYVWGAIAQPIAIIFGSLRDLVDFYQSLNILCHSLEGFLSYNWSKLGFSIVKRYRSNHRPTGKHYNYRAAV
jgi:hypothetical protein